MKSAPDRGRIIVVNFERGGQQEPPEMNGTLRPCVVVQNNKLQRAGLVTVVPLSTTAPLLVGKQHHLLSHLSFRGWPMDWDGQGTARWAKCDYVATIALSRCTDPYVRDAYDVRRYLKLKVIKADLEAIDRCVLWSLGIDPTSHIAPLKVAGPED
jgi:uncharacterized protein YifN (PemK superfamily)